MNQQKSYNQLKKKILGVASKKEPRLCGHHPVSYAWGVRGSCFSQSEMILRRLRKQQKIVNGTELEIYPSLGHKSRLIYTRLLVAKHA